MSITIHAPAKINLWLEIKARRPDGYHDIESVMQTVTLCDTLTIDKADAIRIACSDASLDCGEKNLCHRAASAFFAASGIDGGAAIHIEKRIPVAGGLAGGSADAAATLLGLNRLYDAGLCEDALCRIGAKIGADVPFCIKQGISITRGIGDIFADCEKLPPCHIVVACAGEGVSTPWAYGRLDELYDFAKRPVSADSFAARLREGSLTSIAEGMTNIFEAAVLPVREMAVKIKKIMQDGGALRALMSGSGPSVFGIFDNAALADNTLQMLEGMGITAHRCEPYYPEK
ncbi:MAG: 4-(cytidine 5'-diphospho)-2-C-methyl-D-erythritol kinase [Ruminococcaceae bacterium]|nr:4-(cytidine 5'-diphospho)-2-C-methyl-D-erythritol kinase [Oscillospiraceae bacterium]